MLDLKGPLPRITKIGNSEAFIKVNKGETLQFINEKRGFENEDFIQIDHKVLNILEPGDKIQFENSQLIIEVQECKGAEEKKEKKPKRTFTSLNLNVFLNKGPNRKRTVPEKRKSMFFDPKTFEDPNIEHSTDNVISSEEENLILTNKKDDSYEELVNDCIVSSKKRESLKKKAPYKRKMTLDDENKSSKLIKRNSKTSKTIHFVGKRPKHRAVCKVIRGGVLRPLMKVYVSGKDLITELKLKCVTGKEVVDVSRGTESVWL